MRTRNQISKIRNHALEIRRCTGCGVRGSASSRSLHPALEQSGKSADNVVMCFVITREAEGLMDQGVSGSGADVNQQYLFSPGACKRWLFAERQEVEALMDRGVSGISVGFDGKSVGRRGGHGPVPIHNPDPRKLREVAVRVGTFEVLRCDAKPDHPWPISKNLFSIIRFDRSFYTYFYL